MDTLTFIESLIKSLAWTIFLLISIILLRGSFDKIIDTIKEKLGLLKGAKYKELELLFDTGDKISSYIEKVKPEDSKSNKEKMIKEMEFKIMLNNIQMGFEGTHIASILFMLSKNNIPKSERKRIHLSIQKVLKYTFESIEKYIENPNIISHCKKRIELHKNIDFS